jgi:hypothetical protein
MKNIVQNFYISDQDNISLTLINGTILNVSQYEIRDVIFKVGNTKKIAKSIIVEPGELHYTVIPEFYTNVPNCSHTLEAFK